MGGKTDKQPDMLERQVAQAAYAVGSGKSSRKMTKKMRIVVAVALVAVLLAMLLIPGFGDWMYSALGIRRSEAAVAGRVEGPVKVHVINVLQGDAALLEANGEYALMDAGPPEGQDMLLGYLQDLGVKELRYVFLTHPHNDHYGGMAAVLKQFRVGQVVLPDMTKTDSLPTASSFSKLLTTIDEEKIPAVTAAAGDEYPLGGGSVRVLQAGVEAKDNHNLLSLALLFEANGFRVLNTGDAEKVNERALLEEGTNVQADVFLAAHHGSSTSNLVEFVQAVRPQVVVISLAADNSYGHPHREVLEMFADLGVPILRTDVDGTVVLAPGENGQVVYDVYNGI